TISVPPRRSLGVGVIDGQPEGRRRVAVPIPEAVVRVASRGAIDALGGPGARVVVLRVGAGAVGPGVEHLAGVVVVVVAGRVVLNRFAGDQVSVRVQRHGDGVAGTPTYGARRCRRCELNAGDAE